MRNPRPEAYSTRVPTHKPEAVNLSGVVPLKPKATKTTPVFSKSASPAARSQDTVVSRYHDTTLVSPDEPLVSMVRKAVKTFGKEAATHRFTQAEKNAIAEVVYGYRSRGIRTSENEIARIAINYLVYDYQRRGQASILHQCLLALDE